MPAAQSSCARRSRQSCVERDGFVVRVGGAAPDEMQGRRVRQRHRPARPGAGAAHRRFDPAHIPRPWFAKGNYFALTRRPPFTHLIYPVPEPGGLGVHLTLDLAGQARFGPDVEWLDIDSPDAIDYAVDPARAAPFYAAVRRYWPGLEDATLVPAYSGVRPKLQGPGAAASDFMLQGPEAHGVRPADEPVRHRVARPDGEPGDRRGSGAAARRLSAQPGACGQDALTCGARATWARQCANSCEACQSGDSRRHPRISNDDGHRARTSSRPCGR